MARSDTAGEYNSSSKDNLNWYNDAWGRGCDSSGSAENSYQPAHDAIMTSSLNVVYSGTHVVNET